MGNFVEDVVDVDAASPVATVHQPLDDHFEQPIGIDLLDAVGWVTRPVLVLPLLAEVHRLLQDELVQNWVGSEVLTVRHHGESEEVRS